MKLTVGWREDWPLVTGREYTSPPNKVFMIGSYWMGRSPAASVNAAPLVIINWLSEFIRPTFSYNNL